MVEDEVLVANVWLRKSSTNSEPFKVEAVFGLLDTTCTRPNKIREKFQGDIVKSCVLRLIRRRRTVKSSVGFSAGSETLTQQSRQIHAHSAKVPLLSRRKRRQ